MPNSKAVADSPVMKKISPDGIHNGDIPPASSPFSTITLVADVDNIPSGVPEILIGLWLPGPTGTLVFFPDRLMSFDNVAVGSYQVSGDLKYFPYYAGEFSVAIRWGTNAPMPSASKPIKIPSGMVDFTVDVERKKKAKEAARTA